MVNRQDYGIYNILLRMLSRGLEFYFVFVTCILYS
jgi:hypothetical protein